MANQNDFTWEDKKVVLLEYLYCGRSARHTVESLERMGYPNIPKKETVTRWSHKYTEELQELEHKHADSLGKRVAGKYEAIAIAYTDAQAIFLERLLENADDVPLRELPNTLRSLAVSAGVATDKSQLLRGKPTQNIARIGVNEIIGELQRALGFDVNSTAIEVPQPELEAISSPVEAIGEVPPSDSLPPIQEPGE